MKTILLLFLIPITYYSQTKDEVYKELIKQNVKHPEIVLAQSILETGWYKCSGCSLDNNNLFGFLNHKKKEYFYYDTWQESVGGYLRGIQYKYEEEKYDDYYDFLTKIGYASDPNYIKKLKILTTKTPKL